MPLVTTPIPERGDGLQVLPVGRREKKKEGVRCFLPFLLLETPTPVCSYTWQAFYQFKRGHRGTFPRTTSQQPMWDDSVGRGEKNKFMLSYFSMRGAERQLTGTCLDSCARAGHSSPSTNAHMHMCCGPFGCHRTFKQIYRHKILGRVLDSSITPPQTCAHTHTVRHSFSSASMPRLSLSFACTHTHTCTCVRTHTLRLTYKHMWAWLEGCGWLTNGTVFIFCLWHDGGNDSIIVLSAQHSLPISIQNCSAAGYPRFWNLQRHTFYAHKQKESVAVVVTKSHEKNAFHFFCVHS